VCGLARAEYPLVAAQIKVPLDRTVSMAVPSGQFGLRGGWSHSATEASGKKTNLCSLPTTMSVMVGLKFSCAQASGWAGVRGDACILRMLGSFSLSVASNSPSETPSARDRFSSQKLGRLQRWFTHRDRTRCAWGVCPWRHCIARIGARIYPVIIRTRVKGDQRHARHRCSPDPR
jgi:hypothetical protein